MIRCAVYTRTNVGNDIHHEELHLRQRPLPPSVLPARRLGLPCRKFPDRMRAVAGVSWSAVGRNVHTRVGWDARVEVARRENRKRVANSDSDATKDAAHE
jgi:hypothetical protein